MLSANDKMEILTAVRAAIGKTNAELNEVWLSPEELCKQFQFITKDWLRRYGKLLPRTCAEVMDAEGNVTRSHYAYARNRIQQMIMDGSIQKLTMEDGCVYAPSRRRGRVRIAARG